MTIYIAKDIDETIDYAFVKSVPEDITFVDYSLSSGASLSVLSCNINQEDVYDFDGKLYPANRMIILWVAGGTEGSEDVVTLRYHTEFGRILDENVVFTMLKTY